MGNVIFEYVRYSFLGRKHIVSCNFYLGIAQFEPVDELQLCQNKQGV